MTARDDSQRLALAREIELFGRFRQSMIRHLTGGEAAAPLDCPAHDHGERCCVDRIVDDADRSA